MGRPLTFPANLYVGDTVWDGVNPSGGVHATSHLDRTVLSRCGALVPQLVPTPLAFRVPPSDDAQTPAIKDDDQYFKAYTRLRIRP